MVMRSNYFRVRLFNVLSLRILHYYYYYYYHHHHHHHHRL